MRELADSYLDPMVFHSKARRFYKTLYHHTIPRLTKVLRWPPDRELLQLIRTELGLLIAVTKNLSNQYRLNKLDFSQVCELLEWVDGLVPD